MISQSSSEYVLKLRRQAGLGEVALPAVLAITYAASITALSFVSYGLLIGATIGQEAFSISILLGSLAASYFIFRRLWLSARVTRDRHIESNLFDKGLIISFIYRIENDSYAGEQDTNYIKAAVKLAKRDRRLVVIVDLLVRRYRAFCDNAGLASLPLPADYNAYQRRFNACIHITNVGVIA